MPPVRVQALPMYTAEARDEDQDASGGTGRKERRGRNEEEEYTGEEGRWRRSRSQESWESIPR